MTGYLAFEIRRTLRDAKFLLFAVALPVGLYLLMADRFADRGAPASYVMGGVAAFGAMKAALDTGARTAVERDIGWQRQLRLTPLSGGGYLLAKGSVAMVVALPPVAGVSLVAALAGGVHLSPGGWVSAVLGVWAGTVPFALLGLLIGQLATARNLQAYQGAVVLLLSFVGGLFIPVSTFPRALATVARVLPSYWLAQVGHATTLGGDTWRAALVLTSYALVLGAAVAVRYRHGAAQA
ncbi:ABC transporter permease [Microbispora triticiradicis]|uniref:ABC transporter permease n=2 Tax=Microbispora TaxID=2005 RepID=A0ABY3LRM1_9ACTN|nr:MULTISPECIES: ABC transporter permease [Microbispora]TLP62043.1 ABC transporter permease [Microbispora fusca]TYB51270.1 ABC transporter permease [Microbispora tritici]GLW21777.1 ABC transporter [Microbispora amethystogenes]